LSSLEGTTAIGFSFFQKLLNKSYLNIIDPIIMQYYFQKNKKYFYMGPKICLEREKS